MGSSNEHGFSLIELMVAVAVTGIVVAMIVSAFGDQQKARLSQMQVVDMQQSVRAGILLMTNEIRMIGYDPYGKYDVGITNAGNGVPEDETYTPSGETTPVAGTGPLTFTLVADDDCIDNDDDSGKDDPVCTDFNVDEEGELKTVSFVRYDAYDDNDNDVGMASSDGGNNQPLIENIQNLIFEYLDADGNSTTTIDDITDVRINVTVQVDGNRTDYTLQNATRTISTIVHCRNLSL